MGFATKVNLLEKTGLPTGSDRWIPWAFLFSFFVLARLLQIATMMPMSHPSAINIQKRMPQNGIERSLKQEGTATFGSLKGT